MQKYLPRTDVSFCTDCIDICLFLHFDNTFHWLIMNCLPKSQTQYRNANSSAVATVDRTVNDLLRLVLYCSIYLVLKLYWNFLFLCEIHHNGNIAHATCGGVIFYKLCWNRCIYYQLLYLFLLFRVGRPPSSPNWWIGNSTTNHTHTRLTALCPGLPGWAGTRKVKLIWSLLKQETVSGSGISWAICKSAHRSRQITMPTPHHSVFYRPDALPAAQPTASKHWRHHFIYTKLLHSV